MLIAGVGNVLRGDDGFGVAVIERLLEKLLPDGVRAIDIGIGGIHLVQELLEPVDALVVVDAVDLGRAPGTVLVISPDVRDARSLSLIERHDELADVHYATPERALMLARSLDVLPPIVWMIGCQPSNADDLGHGLSEPVEKGIEAAVAEVRKVATDLGISWD